MGRRSTGQSPTTDPTRPVTLARAAVAVSSLGLQALYGEDRIVLPWVDHLLVIRRTMPAQPTAPALLTFHVVIRTRLPLTDLTDVCEVVNLWNQERLGPTLVMDVQGDLDDSQIQLVGRSAAVIDAGLSDEQLLNAVELAVETSVLVTQELIAEFPYLATEDSEEAESIRTRQDDQATRGTLTGLPAAACEHPVPKDKVDPRNVHPAAGGPDQPGVVRHHFLDDGIGPPPSEVALEHIQAALSQAHIEKQQIIDDLVLAWINGILFAFYIDNGPSLLVRAFWEAEADPEYDSTRLFLVCNDFNADSFLVKAFTQEDRDGLQVRMEFTVPLAPGLNANQLTHVTKLAVAQVISAVDAISREATGLSAVEWPRS